MAVSNVSNTELVLISRMNKVELDRIMAGKSVAGGMVFRKELQKALASYSRQREKGRTRFDVVEARTIWICNQIEMWCRRAYFKAMLPKVIAAHPHMALAKKQQAKQYLQQKWENFMKSQNY